MDTTCSTLNASRRFPELPNRLPTGKMALEDLCEGAIEPSRTQEFVGLFFAKTWFLFNFLGKKGV